MTPDEEQHFRERVRREIAGVSSLEFALDVRELDRRATALRAAWGVGEATAAPADAAEPIPPRRAPARRPSRKETR